MEMNENSLEINSGELFLGKYLELRQHAKTEKVAGKEPSFLSGTSKKLKRNLGLAAFALLKLYSDWPVSNLFTDYSDAVNDFSEPLKQAQLKRMFKRISDTGTEAPTSLDAKFAMELYRRAVVLEEYRLAYEIAGFGYRNSFGKEKTRAKKKCWTCRG